ncbi:MAG: DCC1-like thiol-disulfide oxidoreductase family protein [Flavipsychrobacter sp.]|nr:DCC1-like thiol-disulfide oxidoreductase family protein [Flavipsychrobacter sp.]
MNTNDRPVLFFDGVCNLCNQSVQFIIRHDKKKQFLFAPLQGVAGEAALKHLGNLKNSELNSVVLFYKNKYYTRSNAVLQVLAILGSTWKVFLFLHILPGFIRDGLYNRIARSRYKWFGKTDSCMLPAPDLKERFLE